MKLTSDHQNHDVATATAKNEDAVKMTLSVLDVLSRIGDMIVANVVPRPPRSSYNLLNLRDRTV
jgi:hypothetical protein